MFSLVYLLQETNFLVSAIKLDSHFMIIRTSSIIHSNTLKDLKHEEKGEVEEGDRMNRRKAEI